MPDRLPGRDIEEVDREGPLRVGPSRGLPAPTPSTVGPVAIARTCWVGIDLDLVARSDRERDREVCGSWVLALLVAIAVSMSTIMTAPFYASYMS